MTQLPSYLVDPLCHIATLDLNIAMLAISPSRTSRRCPCLLARSPPFFVLPTHILARTLPHLHCCSLRPPCHLIRPPLPVLRIGRESPSHPSMTLVWNLIPVLVGSLCVRTFLGSASSCHSRWVWLEPEGTLGAPRGRGSLPVAILAFVPIVHPRCSINCQGYLGVASSVPFGPGAPLGD